MLITSIWINLLTDMEVIDIQEPFKRRTNTCCEYSGDLKSNHLKSVHFEGQILNGPVFKWSDFRNGYSYSPNHSKTGPFKIRTFMSKFQMVLEKMVAICPEKLLGFQISDPIQNPDHLQPNLFLNIQIQTSPDFRSPL